AATAQTPVAATGLPAGRTPVINPQAPVVADLNQPTGALPLPLDTPPQPVAATAATAALPDVQIGDRPSMAGERFAAIIAGANRLQATAAQPATGQFAGVLATATGQAATTAPAALAVNAAVSLPDGQGLNATLAGGTDRFILSSVNGRASG